MIAFGCVQDFINDTRALCNSSRLIAVETGGFAPRRGACTSAAEAMSLCFINSWAQRLRICREIASALATCHAAGVLHRDLTSFNVMLSEAHDAAQAARGEEALCWHERARFSHDVVFSAMLIANHLQWLLCAYT